MRGGIFLGKMPLGFEISVKSRIETAVAARWQTDRDFFEIGVSL
jgi:hypothetical protein